MFRYMNCLVVALLTIVIVSGSNAQEYNMRAMQLSPNNNTVAVADVLGAFRLYDAHSQALIKTLATDGDGIAEIRWSPDGTWIAGASFEGRISVWNVDTGQKLFSTYSHKPDNPNSEIKEIRSISWSPDSERLAVSAQDSGTVILDAWTGTQLEYLDAGVIIDNAWAPGAYLLITGQWTGFDVWNATLSKLHHSDLAAINVAYNEAGTQFAVIRWTENQPAPDGNMTSSFTLEIWDAVSVTIVDAFDFNTAQSFGRIEWSPDGTHLAVSFFDNVVRVWNTSSHTLVDEVPVEYSVMAFDWLNNSELIYAPDEESLSVVSVDGISTPIATPTPTFTPSPTLTPTPSLSCSVTLEPGDIVSLVTAINDANANGSSADTICLTANSTYTLTAVNNSTDGPNGLPSITTEITIVGNGATISRDPASPAFRIFHVAVGGGLTLDGVTLSGGSATSASPGNDGGAIYNRGTVNLTGNTSITNGTASADGGAVYNRGTFNVAAGSSISSNTAADDGGGIYASSGTLNVTGGTITDNTAGDEGGGIRSVDSTITLTGANITDNTATGGSGGGLYTTSTTLTITSGIFSGNGANSGGGLYFTNSPSAASLDGVQILNNTGTNGGGLYLTSSGQAVLTSVTVSGNQATSSAAGIWSGGTLTLTDSIVSNNGNTSQPGSAGGIRAAGATLTVSDTVISGNLVNSSNGSGGGVYIVSAGNIVINRGEISENEARNGGGLYNGGSLSLSSIIDDNTAQHYGGGLYITGGTTYVDGSIFSSNTAVDRGGAVYNGVTTTSWIHDSCITGNISADTGGVYSNTAAFDAIDNWWGAAGGPSGAGAGTGDAANSNVTFSPFLTAGCPSGTGEGSTQQMMGPQMQMRGAEPTPTLAPVRVPFRATFEDEVDWYAGGTWVLDTLAGHTNAPSWTVNTSSRGEESILEMRAPVDLRGPRNPRLTFWERGQIAASDVVMVEVLPAGASEWTVLDIRSTVPAEWTERSVSLSAYRGQTIRLRVRVVAGGELEDGTRSTGLWIDEWDIQNR